ncbi:hypothetical protein ACOSP7_007809 [Xanthoceras sorbifolium]
MAQLAESDTMKRNKLILQILLSNIESPRIELAESGRSIRSSFTSHVSSFDTVTSVNSEQHSDDDDSSEYKLLYAAVQRLPTFERITTALFDVRDEENVARKRLINVTKLGAEELRMFIEKLIKHIENDNLRLLQKIRNRIDKVDVQLPTVEVRYKNLTAEAECEVVHGKPLPTFWNTTKGILSWWLWLYYLCPTSLALNEMLTSEYGDIKWEISGFGETKTVAAFLEDYFGFYNSFLVVVAVVPVIFPIVFASLHT